MNEERNIPPNDSKEKNRVMKYFFVIAASLVMLTQTSAQTYIPLDSARKLVPLAKNPEERFRGMRSLDRFYYTTGMFDSSSMLQKEMVAIAKDLKRDSMMMIAYRAIGNRYVIKTDYNFSLVSYSKALEHAETGIQKASLYGNLAYVYIVTENNEVALS